MKEICLSYEEVTQILASALRQQERIPQKEIIVELSVDQNQFVFQYKE